jgi:uncharacterized membrane protein YfhO
VAVTGRDGTAAPPAGRVLAWTGQGGRVDAVVEAAAPARLVMREGYFPGWAATVNGARAPVERAEEVYLAVPVEPGRNAVSLRYRPPGRRPGLVLLGLSAAAAVALYAPFRRARPAAAPAP